MLQCNMLPSQRKMNSNSPNNDPLSDALRAWRIDVPLPTGFQKNVWQRIESSQTPPRQSAFNLFTNWIANALPHPAMAVSYIAALLVIGVSVGWGHARHEIAQVKDELSDRYIQVLDPHAASGH